MTRQEAIRIFLYGPWSYKYNQKLHLPQFFEDIIFDAIETNHVDTYISIGLDNCPATTKDEIVWLYLYAKDKGFECEWLEEFQAFMISWWK